MSEDEEIEKNFEFLMSLEVLQEEKSWGEIQDMDVLEKEEEP